MVQKSDYTGEKIQVLEGLEGVRKRPAMYIGSTGKDGLHHLVYEVVDNSVDEALSGYCKKIKVTLNKDNSVTVEDDGRGIPVDIHPTQKIPAVEVALTKLHAGGKFDKKSYAVSGGLHGVGVSVVNALSEKMIVEIKRDGEVYTQEYSRGITKTKLKKIGKTNETGTKITFWSDSQIFPNIEFDYRVLETRFREIVFLNAGLKILLIDEKKNSTQEFFAVGGLIEFVKWINGSKEVLSKPIYFKKEDDSMVLEAAIQYNSGYQENIFGFVNTINTVEGGTHVSGFKTALTRAINDYAKNKNLLKNGSLLGDDVREGLTAVLSLKMAEPQFEGQTKTKLGNSDVKGFVDSITYVALSEFFEENPALAKKITSKALDSAKARLAAKKARDLVRRKNVFSFSGLPGKLADCSSKKSDNTELYIVEGESAAGSSKMARDKEIQAILPLRGKIINVEKANPIKSLSNEEIANLITAIGTSVGDEFDLNKLRYSKVIIMSVDGEEATFIQDSNGRVSFVKIGEFIDGLISKEINPSKFKVLCFNLKTRKSQFKIIKAVIRHPIQEKLYEIRTSYGRSVKVTSSHSVFIFEDGEIKLKKGNEIRKEDRIVAPRNLPLYNFNSVSKLDVLSFFIDNKDNIKENIYIRGKNVEKLLKSRVKEEHKNNDELIDNRVIISEKFREFLRKERKKKSFSQKFLCNQLGIKQPCVYYDWEKGNKKPSLRNFKKYVNILEINQDYALSQAQVVKSKLDNVWDSQYKNSGRNKVKDYVELHDLNTSDLKFLGNVSICPNHYKIKGINRYIDVDYNLAKLIGFWLAEGSCSLRNGVRVAIGNNNYQFIQEFNKAFKNVFGLNAKLSCYKDRCPELKLVNRAAALFWQTLFGFSKCSSDTKKIPDIIFNVDKKLQLEFLRGYFLGDGTISKNGISYTTVSKDLVNQIMYLLQSWGVMAGLSVRKPSKNKKIISRNLVYTVSITSKKDLIILKKIWENHRNAVYLKKKLESKWPEINRKFEIISEDLIGLSVVSIMEVKASNNQVYDFSVDEDENFIAGIGGLCCHNTDADVDGEHIKTLLLTFFFRYMKGLIENGKVYVALPPLYRIRKGQKDYYVYGDDELKKFTERVGVGVITRFKGLGEMSSIQLWETTMNPKTRKIKKIFIGDAVEADKTFSMLMGDDVLSRKTFIQENAKEANLDI